MNNPDLKQIYRSALNWDGGVSSVYQPVFSRVYAVTGGGGNSDRAVRTALWQVMEGCFQIPDELSVYRTIDHSLGTIRYESQIH